MPFKPGRRGALSRSSRTSSQASEERPKRRSSTNLASRTNKRRTVNTLQQLYNARPSRSTFSASGVTHQGEDEDQDDSMEHIVMAIDKTSRGTIGCVYYVAKEEALRCMEPIEDGGVDAIEILKTDIQPTILIISPRIDSVDLGENHMSSQRQNCLVSDDHEQRPLPYELVLRPASDFRYESAMNKLSTLRLIQAEDDFMRFLVPSDNTEYDEIYGIGESGLTDRTGRMLYTSGQFDLDNRLSVGCVGAVIAHLQRRRASEYLQDDPNAQRAYRISRVETISLKNTMLITGDTLASLQIIRPELHPNTAKQGPGTQDSKESLSVYGLFHHLARTSQGRSRLRQMFLRPSLNIDEINERHRFVALCSSTNNQSICERLSKSLSHIKNMKSTVVNLRKGVEGSNRSNSNIKSSVWAAILEFCFHTIDITDTCREIEGGDRLILWVTIQETLDKIQLRRLGKTIYDIVDLEESVEQRRTVIKRNFNQDLDAVKDMYDGMDTVLAQVAREVNSSLPPEVKTPLTVTFLPQLGFHIAVPLNDITGQPGYDVVKAEWERVFTTGEHAYFKNTRMRDMDTQIGDLYSDICDAEIEISHDLAQRILQDEDLLVNISDLCGELDALLALVHGAVQYRLVRPKMVETNVISIKGGRHILQEMTVPSFVPNDAIVAGGYSEEPNMVLLTGPNFSGKSVYMKQVALVSYMAQVGSFVPAISATIGITDRILTRISTCETVSKIQSAFMIDLQQVIRALKSCTPRSLIVIDELGKGTDTCDGAGLAAAIFEYLLSLGDQCPKVLVSTHFHEILEHGRFDDYKNLIVAHMEVHVDRKRKTTGKSCSEVAYLYNIRNGPSTLSFGNQCAAMNGVPVAVVDRATQLSDLIIRGADLVAACAILPDAELEEYKTAEALGRIFMPLDLQQESSRISVREFLDKLFVRNTPSG